jgi:hypothetical protein
MKIFMDDGVFSIITAEYEGVISTSQAVCMLDITQEQWDKYFVPLTGKVEDYDKFLDKYKESVDFLTIDMEGEKEPFPRLWDKKR